MMISWFGEVLLELDGRTQGSFSTLAKRFGRLLWEIFFEGERDSVQREGSVCPIWVNLWYYWERTALLSLFWLLILLFGRFCLHGFWREFHDLQHSNLPGKLISICRPSNLASQVLPFPPISQACSLIRVLAGPEMEDPCVDAIKIPGESHDCHTNVLVRDHDHAICGHYALPP